MTKVAHITYTAEQAQEIVDHYNRYAKHPLTADQAHFVFHDNSELEMEENGYTDLEIGQYETIDGRPHTWTISKDEVSLVWEEC